MRVRIAAMRTALVAALQAAGVTQDLSYITRQQGMFSYSGLSASQMQRLRQDYGVYGVDSGRLWRRCAERGQFASRCRSNCRGHQVLTCCTATTKAR